MQANYKIYNKREVISGYLFLAPAFLYMLALIGYPLFYNISLSFRNLDVTTFKGNTSVFVGLDNYIALFKDPVFIQSLGHTFRFTIWCLVFQFAIGFLMAMFFNKKFPLRGPIRGSMLISYMMPMSVTALVFKNMLATNANEGVVNYLLSLLGLMDSSNPVGWLIDERYALWGVIITNCWVGIPFNMLLLTTGLSTISEDLYESASIDGANIFTKFIYITVPMLRPAIFSVLMLGFIYTFKVFDLIFIMTKGGPLTSTEVLSTYSYKFSFVSYKFSMGAASAVVLFSCLLVVGVFYLWLIRKDEVN